MNVATYAIVCLIAWPYIANAVCVAYLKNGFGSEAIMGNNRLIRTALFALTCIAQVSWAAYSWGNVALGGGGFVTGILTSAAEKNLIYSRTDVGGAYRWNEAGQNWIPITDWVSEADNGLMGVESFAIDPQHPNKIFLLLGTSYFSGGKTVVARSNDYGTTFKYTEVTAQFKAHGNGTNRHTGEKIAVDPNKPNILLCGSRADGLFQSLDSGETWTSVASFPVTTTANGNGISFVLFDKSSATKGSATPTIYVGAQVIGGSNLFVSKDGGNSWNPVAGANTTYMPERAVLASDGRMYITYGDAANAAGAIYRYDTKASSNAWTEISPQAAKAYGGISVDASNPQRLLATTFSQWQWQTWGNNVNVWGDHVFLSTDGGASWTDLIGANKFTFDANGSPWIKDHALHWAGSIEIDPFNSDRAFVISGNGLFSTSNLSGAVTNWKFMCKGLEESVPFNFISLPNGPFFYVIGDYDGAINSNLDVYATSSHTPSLGTTQGLAFAWKASNIIARGAAEIYYSENTGTAWTKLTKPAAANTYDLALSADGATLLWATDASTVWRGTTKGTAWTQSTGLGFNARPIPDAVNSNKFYAYNPTGGAFYLSTDGGASFTQVSTLGGGGNARPRAVPGVEGDVWVALSNNGLTRSTNSGTTFAKVASVTKCTHIGFGKAANGNTYPAVYIWGSVGGVVGMFRSDDIGVTWVRINDDQHQFGGPGNAQLIDGDMNVYGRVFMSSVGRGIVYGDLIPEAVNDAPSNIILSATSINEGQAIGTTVGIVTATDPNLGNTFTFSMAPTGADNASFSISGTSLVTNEIFKFASKASYNITLRVTDQGGLTYDKAFTISVIALPSAIHKPSVTGATKQYRAYDVFGRLQPRSAPPGHYIVKGER